MALSHVHYVVWLDQVDNEMAHVGQRYLLNGEEVTSSYGSFHVDFLSDALGLSEEDIKQVGPEPIEIRIRSTIHPNE